MIPGYRNMDSYPFQRNQIQFPHYYHPGMEPIPPQMTKSPFPYEQPWPYASNYNHPMPPHFCYGHNNYPYYNNHMPSYPHVPFPSPMYYSGGCPSFFGTYSPQSHYNMELPRYEYDKYMPREHHCCGCHNHSCDQKEDKSVKVEERKPDVGMKENDAMVPIQFRNFPYPLAWIPPEYYGNKQPENFTTAKVDEQDKMSHDKRPDADVQPKVEPRMWSGWLPFDVKGDPNMFRDGDRISSLKKETDSKKEEAENGRMEQKNQSDQKRSEFPFPFFLFPYYNNQEEGGRTKTDDVKFTDRSVSDVTEKLGNQRSIPVKQIESNHEKNDSKGSEKREMNVAEENVAKKDSHSMSKRQSTSPPKGSKLPPVCLRVDPLPRKKNGNGSSRSPSPPASKEHSKATSGESNNTPLRGIRDRTEPNSNIMSVPKAGEEATPEVKTVQVCQNKPNDKKEGKGGQNMTGVSSEHSTKDRTNEGSKSGRRVLSDADAAVLIQAVYRGYLVRKWEPLKKLRRIGEVSKEVTYVRERIQAFEGHSDLQNDDKQKIAIGETIMRLLLKLDTIQGLHPSLREIRKSLARELVTLQEKLDSITVKNPWQQPHEDTKEPVEVTPLNVHNGEHNQEQQEEKMASEKDSSEGTSDGSLKEPFCITDDDGGSASRSHVDSASSETTKPTMLPNGLINEDRSPVIAADVSYSTSNLSDKMNSECKSKSDSEVIDIPTGVDQLDKTTLEESPVGVKEDIVSDDSASEESERSDSVIHAMKELPVGVLNEDTTAYEKTNTSESVPTEVHAQNEVFIEELPVGVLDEDTATSEETNTSENEVQAENEVFIEELPVRVLDEDTATSEETNTSENEVQAENEVFIEELPVGVLDEDTGTSEETSSSKGEVQAENEVFIEELPVGLLDEDAEKYEAEKSEYDTKDTQLEQPRVEEKEDVRSSEESDGWVKIEFQKKDNELIADRPMDKDESGMRIDSKLPPSEIPHEKLAQQETQVEVQDIVVGETTGTKTEVSGVLHATKHDAELKGDMKLLEENEKLRKLMKELLEAGNEQLSVISNLTGRVKDLEKKLAKTKRNKKVKTKRHKPVTPNMSCSNSSE